MKEEDIILRLKKLEMIGPSKETWLFIKNKWQEERRPAFAWSFLKKPAFAYSLVGLLLIFVSLGIFQKKFLLGEMQIAKLNTRLFFADNKLDKAKITFSATREELKELDNSKIKSGTELLAQTNSSLSQLSLIGEPGKYTNQECLTIYKDYETYLAQLKTRAEEAEKNSKDPVEKKSLEALISKITDYQNQAKSRLGEYSKD